MSVSKTSRRSGWIQRFVNEYPRVHLVIGIAGSAAFLAGSVLSLLGMREASLWLYIAASSGLLIGNIGQLFARHERGVASEDER